MSTLKEFIQTTTSERKSSNLQKSKKVTELSKSIENNLMLSPALASHSKAIKFSHGVAEIVTSNDFISELSNEIGKPKKYESEDDFVKRAKESLRSLLQTKVLK